MLFISENLLKSVICSSFLFFISFSPFLGGGCRNKKEKERKNTNKKKSGIGKAQHIIDHGWLIIGISLEDRWLYFCIFFQS